MYVVGVDRDVLGMATVAHMMSQMMKQKVKASDPVSKTVYKQFKQVCKMSP